MSDFLAFLQLGFQHITDPNGLDHVLFLLVLAAIYRLHDWRAVLWVVTAFTIGHSLTLALAVTGALSLPTPIIEFLIPVTIVATGLENLLTRDRERAPWGRYRPVLAGVFGLVHGAGFANYLRSLFVDDLAVPLLGFNVGIEIGQIFVLLLAGAAFLALDGAIEAVRRARGVRFSSFRLRVITVSSAVSAIAAVWAVGRSPW